MGVNFTSTANSSFVRPHGFYIVGLSRLKFTDLYIIFLAFLYIATVFSNCFILSVILTDHRLNTPKYLAVANLASVDLVFSTSFIPSMIKMFFARDNFMTYNDCLTQMFFYYCFASLESCSLCALGFDRFIAICFPLRQSSFNTIITMTSILASVWLFCISVTVYAVAIITKLSFCDSVLVQSYFCDYTPTLRLSCNDHSLQWVTASVLSLVIVVVPLSLIIASYFCILTVVFRMKSVESRYKALATCTEHLVLVAVFYGPVLAVFNIEIFLFHIDTDIIVLTLSLASSVPPCLNPIMYSLATKEIKGKILMFFHKVRAAVSSGHA